MKATNKKAPKKKAVRGSGKGAPKRITRIGGGVRTADGKSTITLAEFDRLAEEGSDKLDDFADLAKAVRGSDPSTLQRVSVDFPRATVAALDNEAGRIGITRQSLVKKWIDEKLAEATGNDAARLARIISKAIKRNPGKIELVVRD